MRVVCCPDSFKESMSAVEAAAAMSRGVRRVWPHADVVELPLADGGEGTVAALAHALGGELVPVRTSNALGEPVVAQIGFVAGRRLAVVGASDACGIELIPRERRDAEAASTLGVGLLLSAALDLGAEHVIVGLGGSATTDAGAGMMAALGVRFLDADGVDLEPGGGPLSGLAAVDVSGIDPRLAGVRWQVACDVNNPLLGPSGAAAVFSPQKGASPEAVLRLGAGLARWADVVERELGVGVRDAPGAGAAGGLGAAFLAFMGAELVPGVDLVLDAVGFDRVATDADLLFTGEGSVDSQSASGKVPWGVAVRAVGLGVPVVVFGGRIRMEQGVFPGVTTLVPIVRDPADLRTALAHGPDNLEHAAAGVCRLLDLGASVYQS